MFEFRYLISNVIRKKRGKLTQIEFMIIDEYIEIYVFRS